jgi:hypothetical protein
MATTTDLEIESRPSYLAAAGAATLVFLLYLVTLAPTTSMWDTSEYIAAAYTCSAFRTRRATRSSCSSAACSQHPAHRAQRGHAHQHARGAVERGEAMFWFLITERVLVGWLPRAGSASWAARSRRSSAPRRSRCGTSRW